jgi:GT2 family glycosyltransferase/glycosyltransferase involved in cell wall biosynthesis
MPKSVKKDKARTNKVRRPRMVEVLPYEVSGSKHKSNGLEIYLAKEEVSFFKKHGRKVADSTGRPCFYLREHFGFIIYFQGVDIFPCSIENWRVWAPSIVTKTARGVFVRLALVAGHSQGSENLTLLNQAGDPVFSNTLEWDIRFHLENQSPSHGVGWTFNTKNTSQPLSVSLFDDCKLRTKVEAGFYREDVEAEFRNIGPIPHSGFSLSFERSLLPVYSRTVLVSGSNISLAKKSVGFNNKSEVIKATKAYFSKLNNSKFDPISNKISQTLYRMYENGIFEKIINDNSLNSDAHLNKYIYANGLSILIPVYDGFEETKKCIDSVISSNTNIILEIIIGFDNGPDLNLRNYLEQISDKRITVVWQESNLGFVRNVNNLAKQKSFFDFIILNSDTIVGDNFFDDILDVLSKNRRFASISPMSNNATIFSFRSDVGENVLPWLSDINSQIKDIGRLIASPVTHGFCMLINGLAYEKFGLFDAEKWGQGYGEEVDWCLSVTKGSGMLHGCYTGLLVYHKGSVSFGKAEGVKREAAAGVKIEKLHPGYNARIENYQREGGLNLEFIRLDRALAQNAKPSIVYITHTLGGGIQTYLDEQIAKNPGVEALILALVESSGTFYWQARSLSMGVRFFQVDQIGELALWIRAHSPLSIQLNHVGFGDFAQLRDLVDLLGLPTEAILHDFAFICPRINLLDDSKKFCEVRDASTCDGCITRAGSHPLFTLGLSEKKSVAQHREEAQELLSRCASIVAPTAVTRDLYLRALPGLGIDVRLHHPLPRFRPKRAGQSMVKTVAVLGAISELKGLFVYKKIADELERMAPDIKLVFFGYTENDGLFSDNTNVIITGKYNSAAQLTELMSIYDPVAALHFPIWPETFSYTLSETLSFGLMPFYYAIGALRERLDEKKFRYRYNIDQPVAQIAWDIADYLK